MKVTDIVKNTNKFEVLECCTLGFGKDVTVLYQTKADAMFDLGDWDREYEIAKDWDFIDIVTGEPCKNLARIG